MIPCCYENQPGGCRKPHCVFHHRRSRNGVQVVKDAPGFHCNDLNFKIKTLEEIRSEKKHKYSKSEVALDNSKSVSPSLEEKMPLNKTPQKTYRKLKINRKPKEFHSVPAGLKQGDLNSKVFPEMEDHSAIPSSLVEAACSTANANPVSPESLNYLVIPDPVDVCSASTDHVEETEFLALPKESSLADLRNGFLSRRNAPSNQVNQVKRLISLKRQIGDQAEVESNKLDFKIKTLEEIRSEKKHKCSKSDVAFDNSPDVLPSLAEERPLNNTPQGTYRELKINRKPNEFHSVPAGLKQDVALPNPTDTTPTHLSQTFYQLEQEKEQLEIICKIPRSMLSRIPKNSLSAE